MGIVVGTAKEPGVFAQVSAVISEVKIGGGTGSSSVLPLGFSGESVGEERINRVDSIQKLLYLIPRNQLHRIVRPNPPQITTVVS